MKHLYLFFLCVLALFCTISFPTWAQAPTSAKIVFSSNRDGNWEIYLMNPDGSDQVRLTHHLAYDGNPVFSPTGSQILFVSDREHGGDLYLMNPDGSHVSRVFKKPTRRILPTWSPDGSMIAYQRSQPDREIYIARMDDKVEQPVAWIGKFGGQPDWSPKDTDLVYIRARGADFFPGIMLPLDLPIANTEIVFINLQTRLQEIFLPDELPLMASPAWSPSADKIAFSWQRPAIFPQSVLYISDREGKSIDRVVLPNGKPNASEIFPAWSPDAHAIVYQQETHENTQLFKVDLPSGKSRQLTHLGNNRQADWFDPAFVLSVQPQAELLTTLWGQLKKK